MKKITLLLMFLFGTTLNAQVGINTTTPDASSMLDISATDKGVLVPRVSLNNVTLTTLDGTNTAATGLLIWNTNATTTGGNGVGFYFYNGTQWMPITQTATIDSDWYEENTTTVPNSITDDIYTQGNVGIGVSTVNYPLHVQTQNNSRTLNLLNTNNVGSINGIYNQINESSPSTGSTTALVNSITRTNQESITGISNGFSNSSVTGYYGSLTGYGNSFANTTSKKTYGLINRFQGITETAFGVRNLIDGTFDDLYGLSNTQISTTGLSGNFYGLYNNFTGDSSGNRYGTYTNFEETGIGDKYGEYINIANTAGGTHYGLYSNATKAGSFAGYFLGNVSIGTTIGNSYILPSSRGTNGQVMTTNGTGNVTWQNSSASVNNLDQAYDQGGAGAGKNIDATDGAVRINGDDGFLVTGTFAGGNTIDTEVTGTGTRMFFNPKKAAFRAGRAVVTSWDDINLGEYSTAFGYYTTASGQYSTAFGNYNRATGTNSTASGYDCFAGGFSSTAFGYSTSASGQYSIAFGSQTAANGSFSTAFGSLTTASDSGATAFGGSTTASGQRSTAFGFGSQASGYNATAFGNINGASGQNSTAFGYNNTAKSYGETAIGIGATDYVVSTNGVSQFRTANQNDRLFVIGNAIDANNDNLIGSAERSNALTIYKNGRMNINDAYNMPLTDGAVNQVMTTNGSGDVSWVNSSTVFTDTDDQTIDVLSLTGDVLNISLQNDGLPTQTIDLSSIDNQATDVFSLTGTTLNLSLQNDGVATQTVDLSSLSNNWKLIGNAGTNSTINFIGTSDNQDLVFKRNNTFSGTINTSNTALGLNTLNQTTTGDSNAAFGISTLSAITSGESNSAFGINALRNNSSGSFNVGIGKSSLLSNTIGEENTAVGNNSNASNTTSSGNIAVGFDALYSQSFNNAGAVWYSYNTAIGYASLRSNQPNNITSAIQNTAVGAFTLNNNLRGKNNTALGFEASRNNRNSSQNVAVGSRALFTMSYPNGGTEWESNNVAIGFESLFSNQPTNATNAINNSSVGTQSLYSNTTGIGNTAMGYRTLYTNTTASNNVAIGINALTLNTATSNVAVGAYSLSNNAAGTENTAVGRAALDTNTSGNYNTAIGRDALDTNSTGDALTGLGRGADVSIDGLTNATAIGYNAIVNESNKVRIGNAGVLVIEGQVAYTYPSDARFKFNIQDNVPGLLFIKKLKPITYQFDTEKFETFVGGNTKENGTQSFQKSKKIIHTGFLAQDIEKICQEVNYDFDGLHVPNISNKTDHYGLAYSQFIMPMIKAIQEQQVIIEQQDEQIKNLEKEKDALQSLIKKVNEIEAKLNQLEIK